MDGPHGIHIVWALSDSVDPGGWGSEQIRMIKRLLPHIRQFVRVRQALVDAKVIGALDNTLLGMIALDWRGMIVHANSRARAILRHGDGLVDQDGFLRAVPGYDGVRLGRLLARALPRSGRQPASGSVTVARSLQRRRRTRCT